MENINKQDRSNKSNWLLALVVVVTVLSLGIIFFTFKALNSDINNAAGNNKIAEEPDMTLTSVIDEADPPDSALNEQSSTPIREFNIEGSNFSFSLSEIRVKKGERVRIVFLNQGGYHDWVVDEFKAATEKINTGESDTVEFIADKKGVFEYYCSIGSHRQLGMRGNLIVE